MRITLHRAKFEKTLQERKLDFRRVVEIFITAGVLDGRIVVVVWTPRGRARRVISMRKANAREVKALAPYLEGS